MAVVAVEAAVEVEVADEAVAAGAVVAAAEPEAGYTGTTLHMASRMLVMGAQCTTVVVESWPRDREDGREQHLEGDFVNMDEIPSLCGESGWERAIQHQYRTSNRRRCRRSCLCGSRGGVVLSPGLRRRIIERKKKNGEPQKNKNAGRGPTPAMANYSLRSTS